MNFKRERVRDLYLRDTALENIFIAEFLPDADANCIKVYLIALMYADVEEMTNGLIAKHLRLDEEEVLKAWNYWEKCGVIRKHYNDPDDRFHYSVEFISLKERLYNADSVQNEAASDSADGLKLETVSDRLVSVMDNPDVKKTLANIQNITGRMFDGREADKIVSWMFDERLSGEFIIRAYKYCAEKGKASLAYVSSVINEWDHDGIRTPEAVDRYLEENDKRHREYRRIFKALGFFRNPTEEEKRKMDIWLDSMGYDMNRILDACSKASGISNPNINYVHSILSNWNSGARGTGVSYGEKKSSERKQGKAVPESRRRDALHSVKLYYEDIKKNNKAKLEDRKNKVYTKVPRLRDIEGELRSLNMQISRSVLDGAEENGAAVRDLRRKISDMRAEKAELLRQNDLPEDFLDMHYECDKCKDTGVLENGERCICFNEKLKEYLKEEAL